MYNLDYLDENVAEECKRSFKRIYPEFRSSICGVSKDKSCVIMKCEFPDGTFYFRVTSDSVSASYNTLEDADRG